MVMSVLGGSSSLGPVFSGAEEEEHGVCLVTAHDHGYRAFGALSFISIQIVLIWLSSSSFMWSTFVGVPPLSS